MSETVTDDELEVLIALAYYQFLSERSKETLEELARLIKQRRPEQVRRMERVRGLG